jgi:hypothetical protein
MTDKKIPDDNHVLRFAASNRLQRDEFDNVIALAPHAFSLREVDDGVLSVTWIEHFGRDNVNPVHEAVRTYRLSMDNPLGRNSAFGKARVDAIIKSGFSHSKPRRLRVLHEPEDRNQGHAAVRRYTMDDHELMELLSSSAFTEIILNRDIP